MNDVIVAPFVISHTHPAMPGHFPGAPVVPAVLILEAVADLLSLHAGVTAVTEVSRAKFLSILKPDERVNVTIKQKEASAYSFLCEKEDGTKIVAGELIAGDNCHV
jgi:3-hydroxymyristoyl/3-hydroxydecanoyl-(acyl carrier protein) dehydratase